MSETPETPGAGETPPAEVFKPITSQDELNRLIGERVAREKAKYADHATLKAKAAKLDEIEAANKTEAEKAAERIAALESEAATVPAKVADSLRDALVSLGIVSEARKVLLTATDPESLLAQVRAIQELESGRKAAGGTAPLQGHTPKNPSTDAADREFVRSLFGSVE